jgi:tRNA(fMet)-specific endonuclease VapC
VKYLLDTDTCIYFLNQEKSVINKMNILPANDMAISIITVAELQFGAFNSRKIAENMERIEYLRRVINTISLNAKITAEYAEIKADLRKSGAPIDDFDILIGATAIVNNRILVTNNFQHFSRIKRINIENWRSAQ